MGSILSPADVYKERAGLPIAAPHTVRLEAQAPADLQHALAPARFVSLAEAVDVPRDRVRQVSAYVEEHWAPVMRSTTSTDLVEIIRASGEQIGWRVSQRPSASTRARKHYSAEDFIEVAQSAQIQASDEFYNQYYPTIAGDDPVVLDGEILRGEAVYEVLPDGSHGKLLHDGVIRGGTQITHGRVEYREKTKGYAHWDAGFMRERAAAQAEMDSRPVRNVRRVVEAAMGELPMHRPVGINFRRDRRSAV